MGILEPILIAVSLCADCFAVTLCSGVTLGRITFRKVATVAIAFAVIQTGLLFAGWLLGSLVASYVIKASHIIGFLLLLYVGGSMLWEGIKGKEEVRIDREKLDKLDVRLMEADLLSIENGTIRHNSLKTAFQIFSYMMEIDADA